MKHDTYKTEELISQQQTLAIFKLGKEVPTSTLRRMKEEVEFLMLLRFRTSKWRPKTPKEKHPWNPKQTPSLLDPSLEIPPALGKSQRLEDLEKWLLDVTSSVRSLWVLGGSSVVFLFQIMLFFDGFMVAYVGSNMIPVLRDRHR